MLTNFKTLKVSIKRLKDMEAALEAGETERMSKKEALLFEREMAKLVKSIGGVKDMGGIPDAIFVVDVGYHKIAVTEANKLGIPVIAVVDTNHSPEGIDYVIPGNDDASKAVVLYTKLAWLTRSWKAVRTRSTKWCRLFAVVTATTSSRSTQKRKLLRRVSGKKGGFLQAPFF